MSGISLSELDASFVGSGGPGITDAEGRPVPLRSGVGITLDCPCGCGTRFAVMFDQPLDGGPPPDPRQMWKRTGDTLETLTLAPSLLRAKERGGCGWHGWIRDGKAVSV